MAKFLGGSRAGRVACLAMWFLIASLHSAAVGGVAENAADRMDALRAEIARHDELYFKKVAPVISDVAYDRLKRELRDLESRAGVTVREESMGSDRDGRFPAAVHGARMMSLEKVYSEEELRMFLKQVRAAAGRAAVNWVVEPKYDGLAVSATYEGGKLVRLATRGDGREGDDVTANAVAVSGLRRELTGSGWPERIEVRGEVFVTFAEFTRVNAARAEAGEALFANPRALAAGSLKLSDAAEVKTRGLSVVFYGWGEVRPESGGMADTHSGFHERLKAWGLPGVENLRRARTPDEVVRSVRAFEKERSALAFPTDGVVIKVDEVAMQEALGETAHAPRWAVAYKFTAERARTRVKGITVQVGRSGVLTPVAELEPVRLGGSVVTRATLHNAEEIARMDVRVGDIVWVEKAGEIIPAVVSVEVAGLADLENGMETAVKRRGRSQRFVFPEDCPACGGSVVMRTEEGVKGFCPDRDCEAQVIMRMKHFVGPQGVAIRGLGEATVTELVKSGRVRTPADFYRMTRDDWRAVRGVGAKTAEKLAVAVEVSRRAELWRLVNGIGVPGVGVATSRILAERYGTLEALASATEEELATVRGVGMKQARELAVFFAGAEFRSLAGELRKVSPVDVTDQ